MVSFFLLACNTFLTFSGTFSAYCEGQAKGTNAIRDLIKCLAKGIIPPSWKSAYVTTPNTTLGSWMTDLAARCASIEVYDKPSELKNGFWLGGMFAPEAFITATRQNTAQVECKFVVT